MICWSCKEPVGAPVCVGCGAIQPPPATPEWFGMLGLERRYHLDQAALEAKYRNLARSIHPDRFTKKSAVERRMALQWTAALNEARRILKDDVARARYLATGDAKPKERGGPQLDPAFVTEIFEWKEAEEETPGVMATLAGAREAELRAEIDHLFTEWEAGRGDLTQIDDRLARLKYVAGLHKEANGEHRH